MQRIEHLLKKCVEMNGSDMHIKTDTGKIYVRVNGDLIEVEFPHFSDAEFRQELQQLLSVEQLKRFDEHLELDFAHEVVGLSRFRGNLYVQRGHVQAAFRVIPYHIQSMDELQLPAACKDFIERPRGLVLVTGPAGSGKSTTLAAMINQINRTQPSHIMTVEDPIEFVHDDITALINQRELEVDTLSFGNALKYVLRQDPDVILVGEMRDLETIHLAITAAETGHLVFGTLHTVDAIQTIDRIVDVFPMFQQQQVRMQLSVNLVGVVSQSLVKRKDGRGRIAAFEVLVAIPAVRSLIRENKSYMIGSIIQTGSRHKMQTLDQSLAQLVDRGLVDLSVGREKAKDAAEFDRLIHLDKEIKGGKPVQADAPKPVGQNPLANQQGQTPPPAPPPQPSGGVRGQPWRQGYNRGSEAQPQGGTSDTGPEAGS